MAGAAPLGDVLVAVAAALRDARDELNRLDGIAGDGDLGLTAGRAADALDELAPAIAADVAPAATIGRALARKAPSTGGTLVAFACLAAGRAVVAGDEPVVAAVGSRLDAARDEIATRGKVGPGDRTMLDAIGPAVDAYLASAAGGAGLGEALAAAATAADAGAAATATMEATTGRAGWLADRARGHEDAGARLVAIVLAAAARAVAAS